MTNTSDKPDDTVAHVQDVPELTDVDKWNDRHPNVPAVQGVGPMEIMMQAVQSGQGKEVLEQLQAMFEFQKQVDADVAKKAYHKAMAAFKADPPKIWRDLQAKYGSGQTETKWSHADLGTASDAISIALGENGLNHTWDTEPQEDGKIRVTCVITHELGHSESTYLISGPDKSGSKNEIQAIGSAVYYLERYTLFAKTGLAPARMDDDGNKAGSEPEFISKDQVKAITKRMKNVYNDDGVRFLKWLEVETVDTIPASDHKKALNGLRSAEVEKALAQKTQREPGE